MSKIDLSFVVAVSYFKTNFGIRHDYVATSLSLKAHPVIFIREQLTQLHVLSAAALEKGKDWDLVKVSGLILVRQRPGTASGICFITIEDETGTANLVVFQKLFDQYRKEIIQSRLIMVEGQLQREGEVIHVIVQRCYNFTKLLSRLVPFARQEPFWAPWPDRMKQRPHLRIRGIKSTGFRGRFFRRGGISDRKLSSRPPTSHQ